MLCLDGDGSAGPAVIVSLKHVFLNKQRQRSLAQPDTAGASKEAPVLASNFADRDGDSNALSGSCDGNGAREDEPELSSESSLDGARELAKAPVDDEILLNAVGFSVALRADYRCPPESCALRRVETVPLKDCLLLPCSVTCMVRGKVTNECSATAFLDLALDADDMRFNLSAAKLQVFFAILWSVCDIGAAGPPPLGPQPLPSEDDDGLGSSDLRLAPHPALVPPPASTIASRRVQLSAPLDILTCAAGVEPAGRAMPKTRPTQVPPGCLRAWAGPGPLSREQSHDPHAAAEHAHAAHLWAAPLQRAGHAPPASAEAHMLSTLAKSECVAIREWYLGPQWRYHSPRSVTRLELRQLAAPNALLLHLSGRPGVAHLCVQRMDPTSGRWLTAALCSAPIVPVDISPSAPHVMLQQAGSWSAPAKQRLPSTSDGWEAWAAGGFEAWCHANPLRPRLRFLVPASPPAAEWRVLWASSDVVTNDPPTSAGDFGNGKGPLRRVPVRLRVMPTMLLHCLNSASLEDAPMVRSLAKSSCTDVLDLTLLCANRTTGPDAK